MESLTAPAEGRVFRLAVTPLRSVVVRDPSGTGDGSWTMEGYAAVFDQETVLWDGRWFRLRERIARGAFDTVLQAVAAGTELVHFNFGHDMNTSVAATNVTGIGGLELEADFHGLRYFARVDAEDPDAVRLAAKMRRGVVAQASFAFTIAAEHVVESVVTEDGRDDELWEIDEVGHLYDVCACPQGAYPQTESHLRTLAAASLGRTGLRPAEIDPADHRAAPPAQQRADMESISTLTDMYELGKAFIADETDASDGADRGAMQSILDQIEALIEVEATEPNEPGESAGDDGPVANGRPRGGRGRRAAEAAGGTGVAPEAGAGDDQTRSRQLARIRAAAAVLTHDYPKG